MFTRRTKTKTVIHLGSKDSIESGGSSGNSVNTSEHSSAKNLSVHLASLEKSRDMFEGRPGSLNHTAHFQTSFIGMIQDASDNGSGTRDMDLQVVDRVEEAQLEGKIPLIPKEDSQITLTISKYGLKVTNPKTEEVLQRHPLHTVARMVHYSDSFNKQNLAVKIGQVGKPLYNCYVFQCRNEDQAQRICASLQSVYDTITTIS